MLESKSPRPFPNLCITAWITMAVLHAAAVFAAAAADESESVVLAASGGRHVFVVRPGGTAAAGYEIMHLDAEVGPVVAHTVARLPRKPEAIAAVSSTWM